MPVVAVVIGDHPPRCMSTACNAHRQLTIDDE
jgi:hypothetical protein